MQNFPVLSGTPNSGGMVSFKYALLETVNDVPDPVIQTKIVDLPITFHSGGSWFTGYCTQNTAGYKEDCIDSSNGTSYKCSFRFFVPQYHPEIVGLLERMNRKRFIVLVRDGNNQEVLFGNKTVAPRFIADLDTTTLFAGRKGHACSFYCDSTTKMPFYKLQAGGQ